MRSLVFAFVLASSGAAYADGWIHCSGPDAPKGCNASGTSAVSVGSGLAMIGAVAYGLGRRRRK